MCCALLLFAAGVEDRRGADRERRRVQDDRHLVDCGTRRRTPAGTRWAGRGRRTRAGSRCRRIRRRTASSGVRGPAATAPLRRGPRSGGLSGSMRGMFSASQSRARQRTRRPTRWSRRGRRRLGHVRHAPSCLGERVDAQVVLLGRAEHRAVQRDPAQEQVQVVLPRHADAAVQLDAVLQHAGSVFAHIGFRDADGHLRVGRARRHLRDRGVASSPGTPRTRSSCRRIGA